MVSAYDFTTVLFNHYLSLTSNYTNFLQYITATLMFGLQFLFFLKFNRYSSQVVTFQKKEERIFQQPALRCFQDLIVKVYSQLIRSKRSSRSHHRCFLLLSEAYLELLEWNLFLKINTFMLRRTRTEQEEKKSCCNPSVWCFPCQIKDEEKKACCNPSVWCFPCQTWCNPFVK